MNMEYTWRRLGSDGQQSTDVRVILANNSKTKKEITDIYQLHMVLLWPTKFSNTYLVPVSLLVAATVPVTMMTFAQLKIERKSTHSSPKISNILLSVLNHQSLILTVLLGGSGLVLREHEQPCKFIFLKYVCGSNYWTGGRPRRQKRKWAPAILSHLL